MQSISTMLRRRWLAMSALAISLIACLAFAGVAFAGTSAGPVYKTYDGKQYALTTTCSVMSGVGWGTGKISTSTAVSSGYLAVELRVYKAGGSCISKNKSVSNKSTSTWSSMASGTTSTKQYQAAATGFVWRPSLSAYSSFGSGFTPYARSASIVPLAPLAAYEVNDAGQTFGSLYMRDAYGAEAPDLILVEGEAGKEGYVYASDFDGEELPADPEKAAAITGKDPEFIPVYLADGVTQIDVFKITFDGAAE